MLTMNEQDQAIYNFAKKKKTTLSVSSLIITEHCIQIPQTHTRTREQRISNMAIRASNRMYT